MRRLLISVMGLMLLSGTAGADIIGVRAGVNYWNYDISGTARYKTSNSANDIDVNRDLGYDDGSAGYYYIAFEHPVPFLPNVRLTYTNLDEDSDGRLNQTVVFGNTTFFVNENVSSEFDLKQTDVTLYYSLLDTVANLDVGLTAKYIDGSATLSGALSGSENTDISGWVPLAYAGVGVDLPLTGLSVSADGSLVQYDGSKFYDFTLRASYQTPWFFGIDAGYRKLKLDLDDFDDSFANVEFDGPFVGAYLHF